MTERLFNSTFENSLRLIILIDVIQEAVNFDMLYCLDFMTSYSTAFGVGDEDLNGDNLYKYSEFPSRRVAVRMALKELVLDGMVMPELRQDGMCYEITDDGHVYSISLNDEYAKQYRTIAACLTDKYSFMSERELLRMINSLSTEELSIGGGL